MRNVWHYKHDNKHRVPSTLLHSLVLPLPPTHTLTIVKRKWISPSPQSIPTHHTSQDLQFSPTPRTAHTNKTSLPHNLLPPQSRAPSACTPRRPTTPLPSLPLLLPSRKLHTMSFRKHVRGEWESSVVTSLPLPMKWGPEPATICSGICQDHRGIRWVSSHVTIVRDKMCECKRESE